MCGGEGAVGVTAKSRQALTLADDTNRSQERSLAFCPIKYIGAKHVPYYVVKIILVRITFREYKHTVVVRTTVVGYYQVTNDHRGPY